MQRDPRRDTVRGVFNRTLGAADDLTMRRRVTYPGRRNPTLPAPHRVTRSALAVVVALVASLVAAVPLAGPATAATASPTPTVLVPIAPCRLLDTRGGDRLGAGSSVVVEVAGECDVPDDATAAALTITAVEPSAPGFLTAAPANGAATDTSAVNYRTGDVIANLQLLALDDGAIAVSTSANTDVVVDVTAAFVPAPDEARAGRFVPIESARVTDTRETGRPSPGAALTVDTRSAGVPDDAIAVAINLTTAETTGPDAFTAYATGSPRPLASALNADRVGQARAASTIVPVDRGRFDVASVRGNHVVVDVEGYFTGSSAPASDDGLFVPVSPTRLFDTRLPAGVDGGPRLWDHGTREWSVDAVTDGAAAAVAVNVTVTRAEDAGHLVVMPAGTPRPATSALNYVADTTAANQILARVSDRGLAIHAFEATHLVVDVTGWFTGDALTASGPAPRNDPPGDRRVTIISDSAGAGMRWNGALGGLQGFEAVPILESCRRLVRSSCRGREGYAPRTAAGQIAVLPPAGPEDMLVIATGYNDWHSTFSSDFDVVYAAARAQGFHHIAWVDYRSDVGYTLPSGGGRSNYAEMNRILEAKIASGDYPGVRRWYFDAYTAGTVGWFYSDGVHETTLGSWGVADWISRHVRAFDDRPCAQPMAPGAPVDDPCPDPDVMVAGRPDIAALYGL